jgi:hypothetical protein
MEFKRIKNYTENIKQQVIKFCLRSKPYDFCGGASRKLSLLKIEEYINFLLEVCEVFIVEENQSVRFFVAVTKTKQSAILEFVIGHPKTIIPDFEAFRFEFYKRNPQVTKFVSEITRKHKIKGFVRFIEKNDPNAIFNLDNQKISVSWIHHGL